MTSIFRIHLDGNKKA
ncbi:hypothetical protein [Escherichia coli]